MTCRLDDRVEINLHVKASKDRLRCHRDLLYTHPYSLAQLVQGEMLGPSISIKTPEALFPRS
jgi:hypothetical protein